VLRLVAGGPFVHHELGCHGTVVVALGAVFTVSAFTSTGIMAPVFKLNGICPKTRSNDAASPE